MDNPTPKTATACPYLVETRRAPSYGSTEPAHTESPFRNPLRSANACFTSRVRMPNHHGATLCGAHEMSRSVEMPGRDQGGSATNLENLTRANATNGGPRQGRLPERTKVPPAAHNKPAHAPSRHARAQRAQPVPQHLGEEGPMTFVRTRGGALAQDTGGTGPDQPIREVQAAQGSLPLPILLPRQVPDAGKLALAGTNTRADLRANPRQSRRIAGRGRTPCSRIHQEPRRRQVSFGSPPDGSGESASSKFAIDLLFRPRFGAGRGDGGRGTGGRMAR